MTTQTLPADHQPTQLVETERDQALLDVFTTALEGGIGYWSVCERYRWSTTSPASLDTQARDFIAVITETGDGDGTEQYVIDRNVISRGIGRAYRRGNWNDYQAAALRMLHFGRWDGADYDADTADLIVQFGLFDEYRYA